MEESALVLRRTPWCGGERPGVEETALVLSRAPWYAGERPGMEEGALVWRRVPWCGGGRHGVEKGALVWMRMPGCHWKDGGWRARFGGERLLRRESSESTSDTSRKRTRLALRGRLMPRRREGRSPPAAPPCIRPWTDQYSPHAVPDSVLSTGTPLIKLIIAHAAGVHCPVVQWPTPESTL